VSKFDDLSKKFGKVSTDQKQIEKTIRRLFFEFLLIFTKELDITDDKKAFSLVDDENTLSEMDTIGNWGEFDKKVPTYTHDEDTVLKFALKLGSKTIIIELHCNYNVPSGDYILSVENLGNNSENNETNSVRTKQAKNDNKYLELANLIEKEILRIADDKERNKEDIIVL